MALAERNPGLRQWRNHALTGAAALVKILAGRACHTGFTESPYREGMS